MPASRWPTVAVCLAALAWTTLTAGASFRLHSRDLPSGEPVARRHVYDGLGCNGDNVSPALSWSGAPAGTRSFAVTVHDPDAPRAGGWWHWIVVDIPADIGELRRGASPAQLPGNALETRTSFGAAGYGGPCPPPGDAPHRYRFTLHALDTSTLEVSADMPPEQVAASVRRHTLARAQLTVRFGR